MKAWLVPILLASCAGAQASPATAEDDVGRFMAEKGLFVEGSVLDRMDKVGQQVGNRASELVLTAMGFLGVPYRAGGNSAESGFDCSGFVKAMYEKTVGLVLPRRAEEQAAAARTIDRKDLQPGDLVFFNTLQRAFSHVGIYVGDGKFIHSPRPGAQVRLEDMGQSYWSRRFDGARRVGATPVAAAPQQLP